MVSISRETSLKSTDRKPSICEKPLGVETARLYTCTKLSTLPLYQLPTLSINAY